MEQTVVDGAERSEKEKSWSRAELKQVEQGGGSLSGKFLKSQKRDLFLPWQPVEIGKVLHGADGS